MTNVTVKFNKSRQDLTKKKILPATLFTPYLKPRRQFVRELHRVHVLLRGPANDIGDVLPGDLGFAELRFFLFQESAAYAAIKFAKLHKFDKSDSVCKC